MKYLYYEIKTNNISPLEEGIDIYNDNTINAIITTGKTGYELKNDNILDLSFSVWIIKIFINNKNDNIIKELIAHIESLCKNLNMEINKMSIEEDIEDYNEKQSSQGSQILSVSDFIIYNHINNYKDHFDPKDVNFEYNQQLTPLFINNGTAFGTGSHETTALCLHFITTMRDNNFMPRNILDLGTGSGILAIACAKKFNKEVLATDLDELALIKAKELVEINGVENKVTLLQSNGFEKIEKNAIFSLITANILLQPLLDMRQEFYKRLDTNGFIILSGILEEQIPELVKAYEEINFKAVISKTLNDWSAVVFMKPALDNV